MRVVRGDLIRLALSGAFDVIVHGANCFGTMGAGIAKAICDEFPEAYAADLATPKGDRRKLGTVSCAEVVRAEHRFTVVNAYTQFDFRGRGVRVDYDAVQAAFVEIRKQFTGSRIGYPMIGAGLARGDWSRLGPIIEGALRGEDHTPVEYSSSA